MKLIFILFIVSFKSVFSEDKIRGIPISKLSFYKPNKPFKCIDGSGTIDWSKVNDDYCDCRDGTDEPGTSACHNSVFFCENKGFKSKYVLSSRVNDGVCDCCDGQDEYNGFINCSNVCWDLGSIERERVKKVIQSAEKGHEIFLEYSKEYTNNIGEKKSRLEAVIKELSTLNEDKLAAEHVKTDAESNESAFKKKFEEHWQNLVAENATLKDKLKLEKAFKELDIDLDGKVVIEELQSHHEFDIDQNGDVTPEEAKEYLNDKEFVTFEQFSESVWPNIKQIFKFKGQYKVLNKTDNEYNSETSEHLDINEEKPTETPDVTDHESVESDNKPKEDLDDTPKMEYDDETKSFIKIADDARNVYNEILSKQNALEDEKRLIEELLNLDYGPKNAYYHLAVENQCFELTDREYIYRLCPFHRTLQLSNNGGSETELGKWGRWSGSPDQLYTSQLYEQGTPCWNGPSRQTKLEIACGEENILVSVSEPSRCEYLFNFETPAACDKTPAEIRSIYEHDEL